MLIKNDSFLVIGTSEFYLKFFNLETPLRPNLIKSIKLQSCVGAIFEMTKDGLFCGQDNGFLNIIDLNHFKIRYGTQLIG